MTNNIRVQSKFLVTSFYSHTLLATFDNVAGQSDRLISSFFHVELCSGFYDLIDSHSFVKVERELCSSLHPSIHLLMLLPLSGYSNQKMENMYCDLLSNFLLNIPRE